MSPIAAADGNVDARLVAEIAKIKAIDNHAHPQKIVRPGEPADVESDALSLDVMEPFPLPVRLRLDNPEWIGAWRALFGYKFDDRSEAHVATIGVARQKIMADKGDGYSAWVLDQLGIERMLANRVALGRGLSAPRFAWVSFVDALMLPLRTDPTRGANPDAKTFYFSEAKLLDRYVSESKLAGLPPTLDEYLAKVVTATLERQRAAGAIAVKFEAAYLRSLDFSDPLAAEAQRIYAQAMKGVPTAAADYKVLQDYLFRAIAREAGRLGLAVHIHVMMGAGGYYSLAGSNPLLLEPLFNDPSLRKTSFVIVHGGWPFIKEVGYLLSKPNVYTDFSAQTFIPYPTELGATLRGWLELFPEKIFFGTDAVALDATVGWEECAWLSTTSARRALALALTGMLRDGEITFARALELAHLVLHDNAAKLYRFDAAAR
jgi:uncharacterized protein